MCVSVCGSVCVSVCPQRPKEGIGYPETGVTGGSELLNVDARNQNGVPCESPKCSQLLSGLSSPILLKI